jgi:hypothetical protein
MKPDIKPLITEFKKSIETNNVVDVQKTVNKYFIRCLINSQYNKESYTKSVKKGFEKINIIIATDKCIPITYPKIFLQWHGHDFKNPFISTFSDYKRRLIKEISRCENLFIPIDLAEVFFNLNELIIRDVRNIFQKGELPQPKRN